MLRSAGSNLVIIISTKDKNALNKFELESINFPRNKILIDSNNNYSRYEIGVHVPVIFHFINRKCVFFAETTENNHQKIKDYFNWK
jgi:hypothetical protein